MEASPRLVQLDSERDERLRALAARYREPVVRYFLRRGLTRESAEDCAQDVFLRISSADQTLIENAEAYLFTIAASVVVDHARKRHSRREDQHDSYDNHVLPCLAFSPLRLFEGRESLHRLRTILEELPLRTREIFLLNRLEGLTYTQLAARYSLNIKSIEKHMSKALAHLRRRFPVEERP
ncbi:MAG TPA: RNA polymerase sigma factor [Asticcacaulis sp.]|nr:RNA polymerase sigma factor [Asticcacaulis sp.]